MLNCRITLKIDDVLPAQISETVGFAGLAKCGCREAWEWQSHDLADRNPGAARMGGGAYTVCYAMLRRTPLLLYYFYCGSFVEHGKPTRHFPQISAYPICL